MYTKKELALYREILRSARESMCDDFSSFILISIVNSLFEKLESIEYLKNKKFFNSARTLFRPCLETCANILFIFEEDKEIEKNITHTMLGVTKVSLLK